MGEKKKKPNMGVMITKYVGLSIVALAGVGLLIAGVLKLSGASFELDKALVACDDKDYSSYVKTITNTTPGNEKINEQLRLIEGAMQEASNANDTVAFGQLYELYQETLSLQSQTSTTNTSYDYSEADEAKDRCKQLARKQKDADEKAGTTMAVVGGIMFVSFMGMVIVCACLDHKKYF